MEVDVLEDLGVAMCNEGFRSPHIDLLRRTYSGSDLRDVGGIAAERLHELFG